jgi:hypothetical protein
MRAPGQRDDHSILQNLVRYVECFVVHLDGTVSVAGARLRERIVAVISLPGGATTSRGSTRARTTTTSTVPARA